MKHAILILAHKDLDQLCNLIAYFHSDCEVFIHVDKKSRFKEKELDLLRTLPNVSGVYRKFSVYWAGGDKDYQLCNQNQHDKIRLLSRIPTNDWVGKGKINCNPLPNIIPMHNSEHCHPVFLSKFEAFKS